VYRSFDDPEEFEELVSELSPIKRPKRA